MSRSQRFAFFFLFSAVCWAQGDRGNITGTITDAGGAAVPGAAVKVTNPDTGLTQSTSTANDGTFNIPYLPVGRYSVSAEKSGFRTAEQAGVSVQVSNTTRVDLQLQVGEV